MTKMPLETKKIKIGLRGIVCIFTMVFLLLLKRLMINFSLNKYRKK